MEIKYDILVTIIGLIGAILTTIGFLPQMIKVIRTKQTRDISLGMYIIMIIGAVFWLTYGIILSSIPIIFANSVSFVFVLIILIMKIKYH
ncbi:MAG TPA: SemiSWEET transporter [Candidatus Kapabacteria bacterium]|jgi:MtN3 and saliva related transmembrane protein|nr:SemiSWEET transporter [Candidatus Kapabacteria bacterium]